MSATQYNEIRFAVVNLSATGSVVNAVSGKSIVVIHANIVITGSATATAQFRSGASTVISGTFLGGTLPVPYPLRGSRQEPLFSTVKGQSLDIVAGGATPSIQGFIAYTLEDAQ